VRSWPPINAVTTACWIAELDRSAAEQHGEHMEAREVGDEREAAVTDSAQQKEGDVEPPVPSLSASRPSGTGASRATAPAGVVARATSVAAMPTTPTK